MFLGDIWPVIIRMLGFFFFVPNVKGQFDLCGQWQGKGKGA